MTPIWGVTDGGRKTTGRDRTVLPATVVYDPALTTSLPADISAASGMNALAHLVEGLYAPDASPVTAVLAEEGIRALADALPRVVVAPGDLDARSCALYGAWLAGWVLGTAAYNLAARWHPFRGAPVRHRLQRSCGASGDGPRSSPALIDGCSAHLSWGFLSGE
jgi:alcohol dehydrogenase class IV